MSPVFDPSAIIPACSSQQCEVSEWEEWKPESFTRVPLLLFAPPPPEELALELDELEERLASSSICWPSGGEPTTTGSPSTEVGAGSGQAEDEIVPIKEKSLVEVHLGAPMILPWFAAIGQEVWIGAMLQLQIGVVALHPLTFVSSLVDG